MLPGLVNGVAYLAGAESSSTFFPLSYGQECGRSGCSPLTNGILADGASVNWPGQVPLGQPFAVREPVWNWGYGSGLIDGDGTAIADIVLGVVFGALAVLVLVHLVKLVSRWLRHRRRAVSGGLGLATGPLTRSRCYPLSLLPFPAAGRAFPAAGHAIRRRRPRGRGSGPGRWR